MTRVEPPLVADEVVGADGAAEVASAALAPVNEAHFADERLEAFRLADGVISGRP
jgi:hypothetical protein